MRFKNKMKIYMIWCVIFCIMMPVMQPILAYAESADTKINVSGIEMTLSVQPYINDLGLMIDAREIAEAYGLQYQFDSNQKSFRITDDVHGDILLMHNADEFYSGKNKFQCEPYFYVENTIPMIEVGFFCTMFDASYEYDEKTNTIFIKKEIDKGIAKIKINDRISSMYYEPFKGEYGLMVGAKDISRAFGLGYAFDSRSGTATLSDTQHGDVILTDGATVFQSGESVFECLPYFYVVNEAPFIEAGFFCEMYGIDYQYNEETKTLELFDKQEQIMLFAANDSSTVSGKISYTSEMMVDELQVQLVMRPYYMRGWGYPKVYGDPHTLGTFTLTKSETEKEYKFDTSSYISTSYPYYDWCCIVQSEQAYALKSCYDEFSYNTDEHADFEIAVRDISGNIKLNEEIVDEETTANGVDVNLILQQTAQRHRKYEPSYTVLGERYTLGTVQFAPHETSKNYVYAVFPYASEEYPDYSLFFEAPGIDKYGYYDSVYEGTTSLEIEPNYNDKSYYYTGEAKSFSFSERSKANLKIGYDENLVGSVGIDPSVSISSDGLDISFILKTAQSKRCGLYSHSYWDEGDTYPLGTVHITQNSPKADFKFDTKQYSGNKNPYYVLFYQIKDNSNYMGGYGYVSDLDAVTEIDIPPENYHFNETTHSVGKHIDVSVSDNFKPKAFLSDKSVNLDLILPASLNEPYGSCGDNAQWSFNADTGEVRIDGTGAVTSRPWCKYADSIKSIVIGNGITQITQESNHASLNNLTSITIGSGITSYIDSSDFDGCSNLNEINVSANNPEYASDDGVLLNKDKTEIIYCPKGKTGSYTIPDGVTSIGISAFNGCSALTDIYVDKNNPKFVSENGVLFNNDKTELIKYPEGKTGHYTMPNNVTTIDDYAFYGCIGLTDIIIPNSVTTIGDYAFDCCFYLENITIGSGVISIGQNAFNDTEYYDNPANWNDANSNDMVLYIDNYLIDANPKIRGNYQIANGTRVIADSAFSRCSGLTSVTLPNGVTSIGSYAFSGCSSLTNVTIPDSVASIDSGAFSGCSSLASVTIPDSVTSIGSYAFSGCGSLTNVTIPDSVTSIGYGAFFCCSSLTEIYVDKNNSYYTIDDGVLMNKEKKRIICCTKGKAGSYTVPNSVTIIDSYAFSSCKSLTSITIPDSVTSIGSYVFSYCNSLKSISIPDSVTSIYDEAFYGCSALKEVYYSGSREDWVRITIHSGNTNLTGAKIYYNGDKPTEPVIVEITHSETDTEYIFTVTPIKVNESCHVYGAAYAANGMLLDCRSKELETEEATTVKVKKTDNIKSVKAFVWTDKMQPVNIEEIEINK